jgi:protein gp37
MAMGSTIEWTEATWNPVTGCTKVSAGCKNCYAERMSKRLKLMGKPQYRNGFKLTMQPGMLDLPRKWKSPKIIFVNSMSDLFQDGVSLEYIQRVFKVMNECPHHTFQILTKRPHNAATYASALTWTKNIWIGTSVENVMVLDRVAELVKIKDASVRFLSVEPLLSRIPRLPLTGINWVIVGGESGPGARPIEVDWVRGIRDRCVDAGVPFFFKQWGGTNKKKTGRVLDGVIWNELPSSHLRLGKVAFHEEKRQPSPCMAG